jgi:hypothetical protein
MRFSTCYSLITRRGFFIYQQFFAHEATLSTGGYFLKFAGRSTVVSRYYALWFEQHAFWIDQSTTYLAGGTARGVLFGFFMLNMFPPHLEFEQFRVGYTRRLFKILTYRGKRLSQRLPAHGQRTRSNSAICAMTKKNRLILSVITGLR